MKQSEINNINININMIDFTNTTTIILIIVLFSLIIIYITWNKCIYLCKLENIGLESSNTKGNTKINEILG